MTTRRPRELFAVTPLEAAFAFTLLVLFVGVRDLPLVDLPQHAVQLATWLRVDAGAQLGHVELNFRTPYLLAYPVARVLAPLAGVLLALKLVFWASIVLQARALRYLCEKLDHDPRLGLLGFALGLGYSFCFGFVSFCAAIPLIYLAFALAYAQRSAPGLRSAAALGATLSLLLVAHGVAFGFTAFVLGPILLSGGGRWWQRLAPLAAPGVLAALWLVPAGPSTRLGGDLWRWEPERLLELPGQLVGIGSADAASSVLGLALLLMVVANLGKPRASMLLAPLALTVLAYLLFPTLFRGAGPLGPRFGSLLVPAMLLAFLSRRAPPGRLAWRGAYAGLSLACLLLFGWRLRDYALEMADFRALLSQLAPGMRLRPLVFDRGSRAFPGIPAHLHVPAYYALEKGGDAGYSFAMYSISVVRFRQGVPIKMWGGAEWAPQSFDVARERDEYDYFLVRSSHDRSLALFGSQAPSVVLDRRVGDWWGYRKTDGS